MRSGTFAAALLGSSAHRQALHMAEAATPDSAKLTNQPLPHSPVLRDALHGATPSLSALAATPTTPATPATPNAPASTYSSSAAPAVPPSPDPPPPPQPSAALPPLSLRTTGLQSDAGRPGSTTQQAPRDVLSQLSPSPAGGPASASCLRLSVARSGLSVVPSFIFSLQNLRVLHLEHNSLATLPPSVRPDV